MLPHLPRSQKFVLPLALSPDYLMAWQHLSFHSSLQTNHTKTQRTFIEKVLHTHQTLSGLAQEISLDRLVINCIADL